MENNKGSGIFLGVVGVATLIVAIIGATFAFFSASANSAPDAITTGGAKVSLDFAQVNTGLKSNLVPVKATDTNFANFVGTKKCVDLKGNNICSVYQFTVTNPKTNTAAQDIYVSLKPAKNGFTTENLKFAVFKGEADKITTYDVDAQAVAATTAQDGDTVHAMTTIKGETEIQLPALNQQLGIGESATYTVVLWINETDNAQNEDQEKEFTGGIFITTASGSNTGITGVITA